MNDNNTLGVVLNSTRLILVGVALCAALFVFIGCPDGATPNSTDSDGDSLIDINTIDDLNAMRHNLSGTAYRAGAGGTELQCGNDSTTACTGYELMRDLDFANGDSYASETVNADWRPNNPNPNSATNPGWEPVGRCNDDISNDSFQCGDRDDTPFTAIFEGNGFTIANLYARASGGVGLFGTSNGSILRVGIVNANIYGGGGSNDIVGGVVGRNRGAITASYVTGNVDGGAGDRDRVGGVVGDNLGPITASYATGNVDGGAGHEDMVGGLVGLNSHTITASYATGSVTGGGGSMDDVGGLVGTNTGTIAASYATGNTNGGVGGGDMVGALVGRSVALANPKSTASYGFGTATGHSTTTTFVTRSSDASPSEIVGDACDITQENSSLALINRWDTAQWDFGTRATERPFVQNDGTVVSGQTNRDC